MTRTATLHIKLDPEIDEQLKWLAADRQTSKGQLVREAISACYQSTLTDLPLRQRQALAAYEGGYISVGRLAQAMGMHVLELRRWLCEHDMAQNNAYRSQDVANA